MSAEFSPEERLLRLIRRKKQQPPPAADDATKPSPPQQQPADKGTDAAKVNKELLKKRPIRPLVFAERKSLYIMAGGILLLLMFAHVLYTAFSDKERDELAGLESMVTSLSAQIKERPKPPKVEKEQPEKTPDTSEPPVKADASFKDFQKLLDDKTLFVPARSTKKTQSALEGPNLRETVKAYRLVGVIPGDEPQAIVEDKKSGQTFFVRKGEMIDSIEVRDIGSGRITLGQGEDTVTLSL